MSFQNFCCRAVNPDCKVSSTWMKNGLFFAPGAPSLPTDIHTDRDDSNKEVWVGNANESEVKETLNYS